MSALAGRVDSGCGLLVLAGAAATQRAVVRARRAAVRMRLDRFGRSVAEPPAWIAHLLGRVGIPALAPAWALLCAGAAGGLFLVALLVGPLPLAAIVAVALVVGEAARRRERARAAAQFDQQLTVLLDETARALRGGTSLLGALDVAAERTPAPVGTEAALVVNDARRGARLSDALDRWVALRPSAALGLAVAALDLGARTGASHARAIDGVAATLRDRRALDAEVRALATQARASAAVLVVAPVAFAAVASAADERTAAFLFGTMPGLACLGGGVALDLIGAGWMRRLTTRVA